MRNNFYYIIFYVNLTRLVFTGIIPMAALMFFNINIFWGIESTRALVGRHNIKSDVNTARILMGIVIVFFICHLPRIILNLVEFTWIYSVEECGKLGYFPPAWIHCINSLNHWLLTFNASVNFLIYCSVGTKFKSVLYKGIAITPITTTSGGEVNRNDETNV